MQQHLLPCFLYKRRGWVCQGGGLTASAAIRDFLAAFDPWAVWVDAQEHAETTRLRKELSSGVGLDMVRNREGELVCLPYPGSPAEVAGLREGDILLAVDSFSAAGAELNDLLVLVLGKAGSIVNLTVHRPGGSAGAVPLSFAVVRGKATVPGVQGFREGPFFRIRIWRFDGKTAEAFAELLRKAGKGPLIVDVRGNSGGLVSAALLCAAQFLPANAEVYTAHARKGEVRKRTTGNGKKKRDRCRTPLENYSGKTNVRACTTPQGERAIFERA